MSTQTETMFKLIKDDNQRVLSVGTAEEIRQAVSLELANTVGAWVELEQTMDAGQLLIYLHADNRNDLTIDEVEKLYEAGILLDDSKENNHTAILQTAGITLAETVIPVTPEPTFVLKRTNDQLLATGTPDGIREAITELLSEKLDFFVMLEQNVEENGLLIYLHSENSDELTPAQMEALYKLGIAIDDTKENNHYAIMEALGLKVCYE